MDLKCASLPSHISNGSLDLVLVCTAFVDIHRVLLSSVYAVATAASMFSDFRIFHFALYSPPVNGHCLDT